MLTTIDRPGEAAGGREVLAGEFGEESGSGPDPDSGHADQDGVKRVSLHEPFNLDGDLVPLAAERGELFGELGEPDAGRIRSGHHDRSDPAESHLSEGTHKTNMLDRAQKNRHANRWSAWRFNGLARQERAQRSRDLRDVILTHGWDPERMSGALAGVEETHPRLF